MFLQPLTFHPGLEGIPVFWLFFIGVPSSGCNTSAARMVGFPTYVYRWKSPVGSAKRGLTGEPAFPKGGSIEHLFHERLCGRRAPGSAAFRTAARSVPLRGPPHGAAPQGSKPYRKETHQAQSLTNLLDCKTLSKQLRLRQQTLGSIPEVFSKASSPQGGPLPRQTGLVCT